MEPLERTFEGEDTSGIRETDRKFRVGDRVIVCVGMDRYGGMTYLHDTISGYAGRERNRSLNPLNIFSTRNGGNLANREIGEDYYALRNYGDKSESCMVLADDVKVDAQAYRLHNLDAFECPLPSSRQEEYFELVRSINGDLMDDGQSLKRELSAIRFLRTLEKQLKGVRVSSDNGQTVMRIYSRWTQIYPGLGMDDMPNMPEVEFI